MKAVVLCAGFATRMYPLTKNFPKPLLEVADRPVLDYLMDQLMELSDLSAITLVSNGRFHDHFAEWKQGWERTARYGRPAIELLNDGTQDNEGRLGAAADLQLVLQTMPEPAPVLVTAGDNIYSFRLKPLWERFLQSDRHHVVALPETDREKLKKTGVLELGRDDRVIRLFEKPAQPESSWFCPPLYFFQPSMFRRLDQFLKYHPGSDAPGHFIDFLCRKEPVHAFRLNAFRLDIGSMETFCAADRYLRKHPLTLS